MTRLFNMFLGAMAGNVVMMICGALWLPTWEIWAIVPALLAAAALGAVLGFLCAH